MGFRIFSLTSSAAPTYMQCPYGSHLTIKLRHRRRGRKCDGKCMLADNSSGTFFRSFALSKAGCPRPDGWLSSRTKCRFRNGNWADVY